MATLKHLQFSIRTLLLIVLLVAICLATNRTYVRWYAHKYPSHYIYSVCRDQIRDGDTFKHVAQYFERAEQTDFAAPNARNVWSTRPWTIRPGDDIWHFHNKSSGVLIQFRDGRVVNHPTSDYADIDRMAQQNHHPVPPFFFCYGVWPFCLFVVAVGGLILVAIDKRARSRTTSNGLT
jgi:hypothetical protein